MESVKAYIFSVLIVAVLCGFLNRLVKNHVNGALIRMVTGVFMLLVILQPFRTQRFGGWEDILRDIQDQIHDSQWTGESGRKSELTKIIKSEVAAYILQQAQMLDADISVEVMLSDDDMPIPNGVCISGEIAPYAKQQLIAMIERELGVAKENQIWK